jgi:hypothetical protein
LIDFGILTWLFIKAELKKRMTRAEWDLAIRPVRLLHISESVQIGAGRTLPCFVVALPRNGKAVFKFNGRRKLVKKMCLDAGYDFIATIEPNDYEQHRLEEIRGAQFHYLDPEPFPLPGPRIAA